MTPFVKYRPSLLGEIIGSFAEVRDEIETRTSAGAKKAWDKRGRKGELTGRFVERGTPAGAGAVEYQRLFHGTTEKGITELDPKHSRRVQFGVTGAVHATNDSLLAEAFTRGELGDRPRGEVRVLDGPFKVIDSTTPAGKVLADKYRHDPQGALKAGYQGVQFKNVEKLRIDAFYKDVPSGEVKDALEVMLFVPVKVGQAVVPTEARTSEGARKAWLKRERGLGQINSEASKMLNRARAQEPRITADMGGVAAASGGKLAGLDQRLKSDSSTRRKARDLVEKDGVPVENLDKVIFDSVRYTVTIPKERYAAGVQAGLAEMERRGYRRGKDINNAWPNSDYKGINQAFIGPTGQRMELQFHTPESFHVKEKIAHPIYVKTRKMPPSPQRAELERQAAGAWANVPIPPGNVLTIRTTAGAIKAWKSRKRAPQLTPEQKRREKAMFAAADAAGIGRSPVEHLIIMYDDGSVAGQFTDNDPAAVTVNGFRAKLGRDKDWIHNHPLTASFSEADLEVAWSLNSPMLGIVAIDGSRFALHRPKDGWPTYFKDDVFINGTHARNVGRIGRNKGTLTKEQALLLGSDVGVSLSAKAHGIAYTRKLSPTARALTRQYRRLYTETDPRKSNMEEFGPEPVNLLTGRTHTGALKAWKSRKRTQGAIDALIEEGGFSYNPFHAPHSPGHRGYMVSIPGHEVVFDATVPREEVRARVRQFVKANKGILNKKGGLFAGGWRDGDKYYLDLSERVGSKSKAIRLGRDRDQLAIFDLASGNSISMKGATNAKQARSLVRPPGRPIDRRRHRPLPRRPRLPARRAEAGLVTRTTEGARKAWLSRRRSHVSVAEERVMMDVAMARIGSKEHEHGLVFANEDRTRPLAGFTDGNEGAIQVTQARAATMAGRVFIHNHPEPGATSFSGDDLKAASGLDMPMVGAVTSTGSKFTARPPTGGWKPEREMARSFNNSYDDARDAVNSFYGYDRQKTNLVLSHIANTRMHQRGFIKYHATLSPGDRALVKPFRSFLAPQRAPKVAPQDAFTAIFGDAVQLSRTHAGAMAAWDKRGRAGQRTMTRAAQARMMEHAERTGIRGADYETLQTYAPDGTYVNSMTDRDKRSVAVDPYRAELLKKDALVHNHPSSSSLSAADVSVAIDADAPLITAMSSAGSTFTIHRPKDGWPYNAKAVAARHRNAQALGWGRGSKLMELWSKGTITDHAFDFLSSDIQMMQLSQQLGLFYERKLTPHQRGLAKKYESVYKEQGV